MNRPVLHGACLEFRELPFANEFVACRFEERLTWAAFVGLVAIDRAESWMQIIDWRDGKAGMDSCFRGMMGFCRNRR